MTNYAVSDNRIVTVLVEPATEFGACPVKSRSWLEPATESGACPGKNLCKNLSDYERYHLRTLANQAQKLVSGIDIFLETSEHDRSSHGRILLLYTAHHHAKVFGLNHNSNSLSLGHLLHSICDLFCQIFLNLQSSGVHIDDSRNF